MHEHVAARQVDFVFEHDGDGLVRAGLFERTIGGGDLAHLARLARRQRQHGVADRDLAARDGARVAAEVRVGAAHELDRKAQFLQGIGAAGLDAFERFEQRAARVPRRLRGRAFTTFTPTSAATGITSTFCTPSLRA